MSKKAKASPYLKRPTDPVEIDRDRSVAGLLAKFEATSFQARNLAIAHNIWLNMLDDACTVVLGLSGPLIPAGMRRLIAWLIRNRYVDVIVTDGLTVFHDIHESLGRQHYQGSPLTPMGELQAHGIARLYDTLLSEEEVQEADEWLRNFVNTQDVTRPYATREFLTLLGHELSEITSEDGILTAAYKARVPVFCPGVTTSPLVRGIAAGRIDRKSPFLFDVIQDVVEMAHILVGSTNAGALYFGTSLCSDFMRQAQSTGAVVNARLRPLKYVVHITLDTLHYGGGLLHPVEDADNWSRAAKDLRVVTTHCDPTIALPMLVTALTQSAARQIKSRRKPTFTLGRELSISAT
ncbi:MAG: deoxyhypusine synthase family protein [Chloracidobacterium sp.]|uniref:Deoxyhypusine synthase family protein n=1 Tax=Chloracidobacterium validum TaxID=2821543 RepID=A0ABX8BAM1_9BACT|nr:deoxyhypusine synthase family protein [Chloracidobacterium validum]QUW02714.1 deoxyhypusine synthase family protein [Chloracidobacterium validum]